MANSAAEAMRRLIPPIDENEQHDQFANVVRITIEMLASLTESAYNADASAFVKEKTQLEDYFMYEKDKEDTNGDPNRLLGYALSKTVMIFARDWARNQKEKKSGKNDDVITLSSRDESQRAAADPQTQRPAAVDSTSDAASACGCHATTPLSTTAAVSAATLQSAAAATTTVLKNAEAAGKGLETAFVKDEVEEMASPSDQESQLQQEPGVVKIDLEEEEIAEVAAATVQPAAATAVSTAVDELDATVDSVDTGRTARIQGARVAHSKEMKALKHSTAADTPPTMHDAEGDRRETSKAASSRTVTTFLTAAGNRRSNRTHAASTANQPVAVNYLIHPNGSRRKEVDCDICGKKMLSFHLKKHHLTHLDAKDPKRAEISARYTCEECGRSFPHKWDLTRHLRSHSNDESVRRPHECALCGQKFAQATHLKKHMRKHSDPNDSHGNEVDCDICGKRMLFYSLKRHQLSHLEQSDPKRAEISARYTCEECGRSFLQKWELTRHSRTHSNDNSVRKPCTCPVCGKQYTQPHHLKYHMKKHSQSEHPTKNNSVVHSSNDDKKEQNDHTITSSKRILTKHDDKSSNAKQPRLSSMAENKMREIEDTREDNQVAANDEEYFSDGL